MNANIFDTRTMSLGGGGAKVGFKIVLRKMAQRCVGGSTDKQIVISLSVSCREKMTFSCDSLRDIYLFVLVGLLRMLGRQAKTLSPSDLVDLLIFADCTRNPVRNRVIVLLSMKAGLRAGEIADLTWDMVVDAGGRISNVIELRDQAAKKGSGRLIPIYSDLAEALLAWRQGSPGCGHVVRSERGGPMTPLSIVVWFNRAFRTIGLEGCSSHSGRRTFITRAAWLVHHAGGSLRDVQLLAGHRSIQTTQRYIDGDTDAQRKLVSMI
jgi:integrase/recombinase XerD